MQGVVKVSEVQANEKSCNKEILAQGRYFRFVRAGHWEYLEPTKFSGVVLIAPVTADGKIVLIEQYRIPAAAHVIEIPAGLVGDHAGLENEDLITAAHRELLEETGYEAASMEIVTEGAPSAGSNSVIITLLLATGLTKTGPGGGDDSEDIIIHEIPLDEAPAWIENQRQQGKVVDLKTWTGLFFANRYWQSRK